MDHTYSPSKELDPLKCRKNLGHKMKLNNTDRPCPSKFLEVQIAEKRTKIQKKVFKRMEVSFD